MLSSNGMGSCKVIFVMWIRCQSDIVSTVCLRFSKTKPKEWKRWAKNCWLSRWSAKHVIEIFDIFAFNDGNGNWQLWTNWVEIIGSFLPSNYFSVFLKKWKKKFAENSKWKTNHTHMHMINSKRWHIFPHQWNNMTLKANRAKNEWTQAAQQLRWLLWISAKCSKVIFFYQSLAG